MKVFSRKKGAPKFKEAKPKRTFKEKVTNATVTATGFVLGDTHFIIQTAADATARLEANIVHRLTGEVKEDIRASRRKATELKQQFIKEQVNTLIDEFNDIVGISDEVDEQYQNQTL